MGRGTGGGVGGGEKGERGGREGQGGGGGEGLKIKIDFAFFPNYFRRDH